MFGRSTDGSSDNEAVKITNSLKPFIKKWFGEWGKSCIRSKKMTVTTAPNASTGLIGVTDAFSENEVFVKYMPNCAFSKVGDTVWCKWMYDNMQTLYADNMGSLNVNDNRTCYAWLSSAGWYRALSYKVNAEVGAKFASSTIIDINIGSNYKHTNNMAHFIRMMGIYDYVSFGDESSYGNTTTPLIDKIRYTYDSNGLGHVDVHYSVSSSNNVYVNFDVNTYPLNASLFVSESLQAVADAPSGETVLATHSFTDNNTYRYLAKSYTTNSYVDETDFGRIYAYQYGNTVQITFNLHLTSPMPKTSDWVAIGRFTLPTNRGFPFAILQTLSGQSNPTNISLYITTNGFINIYNGFNTSADGWYRATITAELVPTELIQ